MARTLHLLVFVFVLLVTVLFQCVRSNPTDSTLLLSPLPPQDELQQLTYRRDFIRNMTLSAWNAYVQYGWGNGTIRPGHKQPTSYNDNPARSLVTAMSTLWVIGAKDEFNRAKQWVVEKLKFSKLDYSVSVPGVVNHYVGAMLACYALSGEAVFLEKAKEIADALEPAYHTDSGLSYGRIKPKDRHPEVRRSFLSELGGQHLEYRYLTDLLALKPDRAKRIRAFLASNTTSPRVDDGGLYLSYVDVSTGLWPGEMVTMQMFTSRFYSYLVKAYVQSNGSDVQALEMYRKAIDSALKLELITTSGSGLTYVRDYLHKSKRYGDVMSHEACYFGTMLALGAQSMQSALKANQSMISEEAKRAELDQIAKHWKLAEQITETCYQSSNRTETGLPLEKFYFNENEDAQNRGFSYSYYNLGPQMAESYFVLWRLTHKQKYRDYAWKLVQKIEEHCRVGESGGYTTMLDVNSHPPVQDDYQPPKFLGATLKYLYLTFTPDDVLPLDQWVFNDAGHPLPICKVNPLYPKEKCT